MIRDEIFNENKIFMDNMLKNNKIDFILEYRETNGNIEYKTDGKLTLKETLSGLNKSSNVIKILEDIVSKLIELESYMIFEENIILNYNDIYVDINGNSFFKLNFNSNKKNNIKTLFQSIITSFCFIIDDDIKSLMNINNYFNTSDYDLNSILSILNKTNNAKNNNIVKKEDEKLGDIRQKKQKNFSVYNFFKRKNNIKVNNLDNLLK